MLTQEEFEKVVVRLKGDEVDVEAQARNEDGSLKRQPRCLDQLQFRRRCSSASF